MNFFKRGILSTIRKPMKAGILFLVVFILGNLMAGSVSIKNSLAATQKSINKSVKPIASVDLDYDKLMKASNESGDDVLADGGYLSEDTIKTIGELSYVKNYDYSAAYYMQLGENNPIKPYTATSQESGSVSFNGDQGAFLQLKGVQNPNVTAIEEGTLRLVDGRVFTEDEINSKKNVVMISDKFAEANNIKVGDKLTLNESVKDYNSGSAKDLGNIETEAEVVGLFGIPEKKDKSGQNKDIAEFMEEQELNTIYTGNGVIRDLHDKKNAMLSDNGVETADNQVMYTPTYVLKENTMLDDFKEEATPLLPDYYMVKDGKESLATLTGPMDAIANISNIILLASIGVTILILSLLTTLFLHDRRHEMGIYISMGERKVKVIGQILVEVMSMALIALTIALFVGNSLSKGISKDMLISQKEDAEKGQSGSIVIGNITSVGESDLTAEQVLDDYTVSLDGSTILLFYGVSIVTIAASTIIPTMYILRLKPKEILM